MVQDGAGGVVALARAGHGHAGGRDVAAIQRWIELPAKLTSHGQDEDALRSIRGVLTGTQSKTSRARLQEQDFRHILNSGVPIFF